MGLTDEFTGVGWDWLLGVFCGAGDVLLSLGFSPLCCPRCQLCELWVWIHLTSPPSMCHAQKGQPRKGVSFVDPPVTAVEGGGAGAEAGQGEQFGKQLRRFETMRMQNEEADVKKKQQLAEEAAANGKEEGKPANGKVWGCGGGRELGACTDHPPSCNEGGQGWSDTCWGVCLA